jgi:hypothetical protein
VSSCPFLGGKCRKTLLIYTHIHQVMRGIATIQMKNGCHSLTYWKQNPFNVCKVTPAECVGCYLSSRNLHNYAQSPWLDLINIKESFT